MKTTKSPSTEHAEYVQKRDQTQHKCYAEMITDYGRLLLLHKFLNQKDDERGQSKVR